MTSQWFDTKECTELEIKKFKSGVALQIGNAVTIEDSMVVKNIMQRIPGWAHKLIKQRPTNAMVGTQAM
ncbi:MAG: hypothetical protein ACOH1I_09510 [Gallionellaceae bacterium]